METEPNDAFLEIIIDTLQGLDAAATETFLQALLKSLANVQVSAKDSVAHWQHILSRRDELSRLLGRRAGLRIAALDYFTTTSLLKSPVLIEYAELKRLRENAITDPLTGLYNRRFFDETLARELSRAERHKTSVVVALFDLRQFKRVNDTLGHAVGDQVLRAVATALRETTRKTDCPCRLGGDEFAAILPNVLTPKAHDLIDRVADYFQARVEPLKLEMDLSLDRGIAKFPDDGESTERLFAVADQRLYAYKNGPAPRKIQVLRDRPDRPENGATADPASPGVSSHQHRQYRRVALNDTEAYVVMNNGGGMKAGKLLDISFRGVAFVVQEGTELPERFVVRLHLPLLADVPTLPSPALHVRRIYTAPIGPDQLRVGCVIESNV